MVDRSRSDAFVACYIHLNLLKPGWLSYPKAWEYSSYREYVGQRMAGFPIIGAILRDCETSAYSRFVESGIAG